MSSVMNNSYTDLKRRTLRFAFILAIILYAAYYFLLTTRLESSKDELVLDVLQSDEELSGELYRVMHGLENDFDFFEKEIKSILRASQQKRSESLLNFLESHQQYFKIRLVEDNGIDAFKIVQSPKKMKTYERSFNLFDLSGQKFFQDLKKASFDSFYFSSMDADVVNGVIQRPIRPTIRVAKRILLSSNKESFLIINIDGYSILNLFNESRSKGFLVSEKVLADRGGNYLASLPLLSFRKKFL